MRLAQLARKISVKPSDIIEYLALSNIHLENNSNAKVNDEHVNKVINHFAPELPVKDDSVSPQTDNSNDENQYHEGTEEIQEISHEIRNSEEVETTEELVETPEVIKPEKVELPGLKVVGKIDLPEPKKKEEKPIEDSAIDSSELDSSAKTQSSRRRFDSKSKSRYNKDFDRRPRKNPVALQREREEREALKRKLEDKAKQKELRTQRYLKKVSGKVSAPKPARRIRNNDDYEVLTDIEVKPKTVIGKILNWFVSK